MSSQEHSLEHTAAQRKSFKSTKGVNESVNKNLQIFQAIIVINGPKNINSIFPLSISFFSGMEIDPKVSGQIMFFLFPPFALFMQ